MSPTVATRLVLAALLAALLAVLPAGPAGARATDGTIANFAGTPGQSGFAGDGGPARNALMRGPNDVAFLADGSLLIADTGNDRVRRVTSGGIMQTAAGGGDCGEPPCGDGDIAEEAELQDPRGVTAMPDGGYLITDTLDHRVRRVFPDRRIVTVAGSTRGLSGDGGPATAARLDSPTDTTVLPDGSFYVVDTGNHRIRHVGLDGRITTVAGTTGGFNGDGGPATGAQLLLPRDLTLLTTGGYVVSDAGNHRLRRVDPAGNITTMAGTSVGLSGDGEPARQARLAAPVGVAPLSNGGVLLTDSFNDRVRRVTPMGAIIAVAGSAQGNSGNGGPAKGARLSRPTGVTLAPGGGFVVADSANATVRRVTDIGAIPPAVLRRSLFVEPGSGSITLQPVGQSGPLPLREEDIVPNGSKVDATNGSLDLAVARDASGRQIGATVFQGDATMRQLGGARPFTEFRLGRLTGCPVGGGARAITGRRARTAAAKPLASTSARRRRKRRKRLWVSDRGGRWRTATGSVSAGSIGTRWLTTLYCDATSVTVRQGRVRVFDKVRRRTRVLRVGQTYLARNRR
jgi:hypothetical protein